MKAQICPVCAGVGTKEAGFYPVSGWAALTTAEDRETCRTCWGCGYVMLPDDPEPTYLVPLRTGGDPL